MSHDLLKSFLGEPPGTAENLIAPVTGFSIFGGDETAEFDAYVEESFLGRRAESGPGIGASRWKT